MNDNINEECAITDAFETQIGLMYNNLVDAMVQDNADVDAAGRRFKRGLSLARKAREIASKIISE